MRVRDRTHLRNAYDFLMGAGLIAANPVNVDIPREPGTSKRERATESEENIQQFLEAITQLDREEWERWRDRAIFLLYYRARLFPVDVARVTPKHFEGDKLVVHRPRAAKIVRISLDQDTHAAIRRYVSALPIDLAPDEALFRTGRDLLPLNPRAHFHALTTFGERQGVPGITPTVLRNSSVAHALARGIDVESLRRASGLKSLEGVQDLGPVLDEAQVFAEFRNLHPRW
jgi:integrase